MQDLEFILYNPCATLWCFIKNMIFVIGSKSQLIKFLSLFFYHHLHLMTVIFFYSSILIISIYQFNIYQFNICFSSFRQVSKSLLSNIARLQPKHAEILIMANLNILTCSLRELCLSLNLFLDESVSLRLIMSS